RNSQFEVSLQTSAATMHSHGRAAENANFALREGNLYLRFAKFLDDPLVDCGTGGPVVGNLDPRFDGDGDRGISERSYTHHVSGFLEHQGAGLEHVLHGGQASPLVLQEPADVVGVTALAD